ncbi:MAG: MOSC domain-containing protein [Rhodobacter sp.]|nr:MOSC domain-containing protein [Rhodobacter sp.]
MRLAEAADLGLDGLVGDHGRAGKRAVTLFQHEHLAAVAAYLGVETVAPEALRRNIHIAGLNLSALRGARLSIDGAEIELTGPCAPCSRMTEALGRGGYNALRGHGGWCARVVRPGMIRLDAKVARVSPTER